jgi:integrase
MGKLTARQVQAAKPGTYVDGKGLLLLVKSETAKSWVLRVQYDGRRRDIGLGSVDILTLAEARVKSAELRKVALTGGDPIAERDKRKTKVFTFADAVKTTHAELGSGWSGKTASQFLSSMAAHAIPPIGSKPVNDIERADIIAALSPIWTEKPQIARKVRHRIFQVLRFARARGMRANPLPDAKEIADGLPRQPASVGFSAIPYRDLPSWFEMENSKPDTPARLALLFVILTAARSGEVRGADWSQIDREAMQWKRPPELMKGRRAHSVALNRAAVDVAERAAQLSGGQGLIFPSMKGGPLSDAALGKLYRDSGRSETVHGMRSAFRDWAAEKMPQIPFAVSEMALSHSVGDKTERAYLRTDLLEQRRKLMERWEGFVVGSGGLSNDR